MVLGQSWVGLGCVLGVSWVGLGSVLLWSSFDFGYISGRSWFGVSWVCVRLVLVLGALVGDWCEFHSCFCIVLVNGWCWVSVYGSVL